MEKLNIMPNATLVVQMIHFGLAYQLITRLLCKPVLRQLDAENNVRDALETSIRKTNQEIDQIVRERYEQWQQAHLFFIQNKPDIPTGIPIGAESSSISYAHPTAQEIAHLVDQVSDAVVRKVVHNGK